MQLSIIIPILNEGDQALLCVRQLAPLRAAGHELILVDGGSDRLAGDALIPWVDQLLSCEAGRARQMNLGARMARGEVFWFLHADTRLMGDAAEAICRALAGGPAWGRFDIQLDGPHPLLRLVERTMNGRSRWSGIATGDQGIFIQRDLFFRVGGFPDQALMEDIEISARLKRLCRPVCLRQRLLTSSRRWERQGILRTIFLMWGLRLAYWFGVNPRRLAEKYKSCPTPPS
ncbi:MAG: TIGR04283 family arsenosugar biosynthesis glycosyltransferase [Candidatus Thiodiazotropha sp.]|jgi:rSAM/selenodomain-associated transferase 2